MEKKVFKTGEIITPEFMNQLQDAVKETESEVSEHYGEFEELVTALMRVFTSNFDTYSVSKDGYIFSLGCDIFRLENTTDQLNPKIIEILSNLLKISQRYKWLELSSDEIKIYDEFNSVKISPNGIEVECTGALSSGVAIKNDGSIIHHVTHFYSGGSIEHETLKLVPLGTNYWGVCDEDGYNFKTLIVKSLAALDSIEADSKVHIGDTDGADFEWTGSFLKLTKLLFVQKGLKISNGGTNFLEILPTKVIYHPPGLNPERTVLTFEADQNNNLIINFPDSSVNFSSVFLKNINQVVNGSLFYVTESCSLDSMSSLNKSLGKRVTLLNNTSSSKTVSYSVNAGSSSNVTIPPYRACDFICDGSYWHAISLQT